MEKDAHSRGSEESRRTYRQWAEVLSSGSPAHPRRLVAEVGVHVPCQDHCILHGEFDGAPDCVAVLACGNDTVRVIGPCVDVSLTVAEFTRCALSSEEHLTMVTFRWMHSTTRDTSDILLDMTAGGDE